jgi:RHS repeat-associated protein
MDRQIGHYSPFTNSAPTTNSLLCRYTASVYTNSVVPGSGDNASLDLYTPRQVTDYVLGNEVGRTYTVVKSGERDQYQCASPGAVWSASSNLLTKTYYFLDAKNLGMPSRIVRPDGTIQLFSYDTGTVSPLAGSDSSNDKTTVWTGTPDSTYGSVVDGTMEETWTDYLQNNVVHQVTDIASQVLIEQEKYYYDANNHLTNTVCLNGTSSPQTYDCCNLESSTAPDGTVTSYGYDALKRRIMTIQNGITVSNILNANGDVLGTVRYGTDGSAVTNNRSTYDTAGQLTSSRDALGNTTTHTNYFDGTGQLIKVTTYPDTSTRTETYAMDGSLLKVTGTAVLPVRYDSGVESDGGVQTLYRKEIKLDANGNDTSEWTKTYTDMLGRTYKTVYASASGTPASQSFFNGNGQLVKQVDPDGVTTLYQYNLKGEVVCSAVDMNTNGVIDFGGSDRIASTINDVVTNEFNVLARRTQTFVWKTNNSNTSNLVSVAEASVDGLQSWNIVYNNGVALTSHSQTAYFPSSGYVIATMTAPDGSYSVATNQYGRLISSTRYAASAVQIGRSLYSYDAQGRQNTATDARNGTTTSFYNNADQVVGALTPSPDGIQAGQLTTNILDSLGRVVKTILPDNTAVTNVYYTNGLLQKTYGSRTYPVGYTYDYAGRMKTMTTWTNFATSTGAAVTTWNYDGYRGFLTNKAYADGKGPNYSYTAAGRLNTRTWVRGTNTVYAYGPAGDLAKVSYSDSTPGMTYAFDRLGRQLAVTNGATVCNWTYNDAGEPLTEAYTGGPLNGISVTNGYDSLLRRKNLSLLNSAILASTAYGYDAASRLQTVSDGTNSAGYSYLANSPLVGQVVFQRNGQNVMTTTKTYDLLNRLTAIQSSAGSSPVAAFNYNYNLANQRTAATNADNSHWVYQYDALGQVISGKRYWADGTPVAGQQFTYNFDDIGNRKSTAAGGDGSGSNLRSANYSANSLNQYTSRDVPGYATVLGSANPNATVTVNLQRAYRYGSYLWDELSENNAGAALYVALTNLAVLNNGTNADIVATNTGSVLLPQTPENFGYDNDGNMTNSGRWTVAWDAENRATSFTSLSTAPSASKKQVNCAYDYQGRRIQKIISTWNGSAYVAQSTNRFVYDGWNLVGILDGGNNLLYSFQWGTDLSGSFQGAGGVGGLLSMTVYAGTNAGTYFYTYDGNGNVAALVNAATGALAAQYEYDPFLGVTRASGALAFANPFLGSTKFFDVETGLFYYGYRYYDPSAGRWASRDLIGEQGGVNLYGFVDDSPIIYDGNQWHDKASPT